MADELTERYRDLLQGSYDCVDRIVLNAYNSLCYSAGGFRQWWRRLMNGSDEQRAAQLVESTDVWVS